MRHGLLREAKNVFERASVGLRPTPVLLQADATRNAFLAIGPPIETPTTRRSDITQQLGRRSSVFGHLLHGRLPWTTFLDSYRSRRRRSSGVINNRGRPTRRHGQLHATIQRLQYSIYIDNLYS